LFDKFKKELINILIIFTVLFIVFRIVFFKENIIIILRILVSLFFIMLSGFFMMYYWHNELNFITRLTVGSVLAFALLGVFSYYLGLLGLHVRYHGIFIPLLFYVIGFVLNFKKFRTTLKSTS